MQDQLQTFPSVISLNVGGCVYSTTLSTLTQLEPDSMLARMFSGRIGLAKDNKGNYFIDRDGTNFSYILNYLRDADVDLPPTHFARRQLLRECLYYQISGLIERLGAGPVGEGLVVGTNSPPPPMSFHYSSPHGNISPPHSPPHQRSPSPPLLSGHQTPTPQFNFLMDQTVLYSKQKETLYQKYYAVWEETKQMIKQQFHIQAQGETSVLVCQFEPRKDRAIIAPFLTRELQEEGLRDLTFESNCHTGLTFTLMLDRISDADFAEQQYAATRLLSAQPGQDLMHN